MLYNARGYFSTLPPAAPVYLAPCVGAFVGADTVCALLACRLEPRELLLDVGTNGELALMTEEGALCCSAAAGPAFEGAGLRCGMVAADGAICAAAVRDGGIVCRTIGGGPPRGCLLYTSNRSAPKPTHSSLHEACTGRLSMLFCDKQKLPQFAIYERAPNRSIK